MTPSSTAPKGLYVYAVGDGNKAEFREVKVGQSTDGQTLVENGLKLGEHVVTSGQYRVQPGSLLTNDCRKVPDRHRHQ